ncbi:hypothetical protein B9Z19DRAFT_1130255 [Tuber borchii]|uniref:S1 motif domain-containing protein n=1 Tax=Tuber borchii TaxID=42251 RepID=A0A2T6ZKU3_TUBBO|nr:hypothetical protein B9Z19DRAFT_1130255 [Tuber borchii]
MGSDKKRKRPPDADLGPGRPSPASSKPELVKQSTLRASKDEEVSFLRGGGSIATPLEFKQISNDAAKDVLFEAKNMKAKSTKKKKKKPTSEGLRRDKKAKKDESKKGEQKGIKVEGLSYKRLLPGTLMLGCISQINQTDLTPSLPNNLTGFVPLTSISESLNEKEGTNNAKSPQFRHTEGDNWASSRKSSLVRFQLTREYGNFI